MPFGVASIAGTLLLDLQQTLLLDKTVPAISGTANPTTGISPQSNLPITRLHGVRGDTDVIGVSQDVSGSSSGP
jgi:hypothetical protein